MRIVDLDDEVRNRELQLVSPPPACHALRCELKPRAEKLQNIRGLPDQEPPGLQYWGREGRRVRAVVQHAHHGGNPGTMAGFARDIDIPRGAFFERQSHEFTATLDRGPIVELVN